MEKRRKLFNLNIELFIFKLQNKLHKHIEYE